MGQLPGFQCTFSGLLHWNKLSDGQVLHGGEGFQEHLLGRWVPAGSLCALAAGSLWLPDLSVLQRN